MTKLITYTVENLSDARDFLANFSEPIILTNKINSNRYYGIIVLDHIFKKLQQEFPQIIKIIMHVGNDHAALFSAIKLGYRNIIYTGDSHEAKNFLTRFC